MDERLLHSSNKSLKQHYRKTQIALATAVADLMQTDSGPFGEIMKVFKRRNILMLKLTMQLIILHQQSRSQPQEKKHAS